MRVMTESGPVPRKDIDDAKESFRQWLVENGVLDIRHDVDRMMLEVQAIAEGREYDGPSSVGETIAAVPDPLDVDNVAMAAMGSADLKLKVAGEILFWLSQAAHPIVTSSYGPSASKLDAARLAMMAQHAAVVRSALLKIQGMEPGILELGALQDAYVEEIIGRAVISTDGAQEEGGGGEAAAMFLAEETRTRSSLLLEAHQQVIARLRRLRYYVENVWDLPQMLALAPPRTFDEWRQCQGILEQALLDAGFSSAEAGRMFGATDSTASQKVMQRMVRRRIRGETVLLVVPEATESNKAARRNVSGPKTGKRARSSNDGDGSRTPPGKRARSSNNGDGSRTTQIDRSGRARARISQQRAPLDKKRTPSKRPAGTKASRAKSRS
jgi:hypothetical protein